MERVDALTREVRALREQIAPTDRPSLSDRIDHLADVQNHLSDVVDRRTAWWRAAVAIGIVLILGITGGALILQLRTRAEIADANRKLCPMVALLIPAPDSPTRPVTPYTQELVKQARLLYDAYGCDDTNGAPHA